MILSYINYYACTPSKMPNVCNNSKNIKSIYPTYKNRIQATRCALSHINDNFFRLLQYHGRDVHYNKKRTSTSIVITVHNDSNKNQNRNNLCCATST